MERHRCPYAHQNNHYTRSRSRSRSRSRGRRRERSRSRGRYNSNIYGHHRRKRKPAQESVIDSCDDEPTKTALAADRMKRTRESESESDEDSSEEKKKKHKKSSKKKSRKSHSKEKSKKHHKKKIYQKSSSENESEDKDKEGGNGVIGPLPLMQDTGDQDITERHVFMDSATPLYSSNKGKINYARLCRLLIVAGKVLLTEVFDKICPLTKLDSVLKDNKTRSKLSSLRKKGVLSVTQWLKLYPAVKSQPVSSRDFDPSLQLLLLTNILDLNVPASCQDNFPPVTNTSPVAGFTDIRVLRDRILCHDSSGSVDDVTFASYLSDITNTFLRFGGDHYLNTINDLKKVDFRDKDLWEYYRKELRNWMGDDASAEHKLGEEPEHWKHVHNGAAETVEISSPELSIDIPNICELPLTSLNWEDVKLPVDIVLFTGEDDEFLSCFAHLKKPERSYHISVGFVYFGFMEDNWGHKIETALIRCSKGHDGPGGALSAAKDAILLLRPKALISVGACRGLNSKKVKLGDIVVSSKLITPAFQIPPSRNMNKVIRNIADGWKPPLKNANGYKPKVHLGALLSISEANKDIISRYPEAIGVEEEAGGFWTAAHDFNIEWLIVKGIKGFENSSHSSSVNCEKIACVMAASVVANILSQAIIFQDWSHFNAGITSATSPCSAASTACTAKS